MKLFRIGLVALLLALLVTPAWSGSGRRDLVINGTIGVGAQVVAHVDIREMNYITIDGSWNSTAPISVGLYTSPDGVNWKALYNADNGFTAADSIVTITAATGFRLNYSEQLMWGAMRGAVKGVFDTPISSPWLKVVVHNTSGTTTSSQHKWWILYK